MVKNLNTGVKLDFEHKVFFDETSDMFVVVPKDFSSVNIQETHKLLQKAEKVVSKEITVAPLKWGIVIKEFSNGSLKEVVL